VTRVFVLELNDVGCNTHIEQADFINRRAGICYAIFRPLAFNRNAIVVQCDAAEEGIKLSFFSRVSVAKFRV